MTARREDRKCLQRASSLLSQHRYTVGLNQAMRYSNTLTLWILDFLVFVTRQFLQSGNTFCICSSVNLGVGCCLYREEHVFSQTNGHPVRPGIY